MAINVFRRLLKEMGATEYDLRVFREAQRRYSSYAEDFMKINDKVMGSKTTTPQYDYESLYNYAMGTGQTIRSIIHDLKNEQEEAMEIFDVYNISPEIYDFVMECIEVLKWFAMDVSPHIAMTNMKRHKEYGDLDFIVDRIHDDLNTIYKYKEMYPDDFVYMKTPQMCAASIYERLTGCDIYERFTGGYI